MKTKKTITTFKGFHRNLKCRDFQYEVGKEYTCNDAIACKKGFHACENPIDIFDYYSPAFNKFHVVEQSGKLSTHSTDSKIASRFITVVKEISFMDFIKLCVNDSEGVNESYGVNRSNGVNWSDGVHRSYGVNESNGVNGSLGVNGSYGVNDSFGVNRSLGVNECKGINGSVFCSKLTNTFLFNKSVSEERANEVYNKLKDKLHGWYPHYNNLHTLYLKHGSDWEKTPIPQAGEVQKNEAWKDMPIEAIDYLKSLPEFDADIFFDVTGIKC